MLLRCLDARQFSAQNVGGGAQNVGSWGSERELLGSASGYWGSKSGCVQINPSATKEKDEAGPVIAPEVPGGGQHISTPLAWKLILQKLFVKSFYKGQLTLKSVNLSVIITNIKNELTDVCGNLF